jgi:hypothetical protein
MITLALAWRVLCAFTAHKPAHSHGLMMHDDHGHGGKAGKLILKRNKAQGRLLLSWVGCVCTMGVLYGYTGTIHHQTSKMRAYLPG